MRSSWFLYSADVVGEDYRSILRAVTGVSRYFGVMQTVNPKWYKPSVTVMMNALVPYLSDIREVTRWPGTQTMSGRTETQLLFDCSVESVRIIAEGSERFLDWANTDYPDDLHFLRADGSTVVGSCWCTGDVWLELDEVESAIVLPQLTPAARKALVHYQEVPELT